MTRFPSTLTSFGSKVADTTDLTSIIGCVLKKN